MKGEYEKAVKEIEILRTLDNDEVGYLFLNGITYCKWGKEEKAHRNLKEILDQSQKEFVSPLDIAAFHACLGEKAQAFEWLEKSYQERSVRLANLKTAFVFENLRSDPRFINLVQRVGLLTN